MSSKRRSRQSRTFDTIQALANFAGALVITIVVTLLVSGGIPGISVAWFATLMRTGGTTFSWVLLVIVMTAFGIVLAAASFVIQERQKERREEKRAAASREVVDLLAQRAAKAADAARLVGASASHSAANSIPSVSESVVPERRFKVAVFGSGLLATLAAMQISARVSTDIIKVDKAAKDTTSDIRDIVVASQLLGYESVVAGAESPGNTRDVDLAVVVPESHRDIPDGHKKPTLPADFLAMVHDKQNHAVAVLPAEEAERLASYLVDESGISRTRVVATAGIYERAYLQVLLARELKVQPHDINIHLLGTASGGMTPLWRYATVQNHLLTNMISNGRLREVTHQWREQLQTLDHRHPLTQAATIYALAEAVLSTTSRVMTCSVYLQGEYEVSDMLAVVPAQLDSSGVVQVVELALTRDEQAAWQESVDTARRLMSDASRA